VQLVATVRDQLRNVSLAQRIYTRLRLQGAGKEFPDFTARRFGGDLTDSVFVSASGQRLTRRRTGSLHQGRLRKKASKRLVDQVVQAARPKKSAGCWGASDAGASRLPTRCSCSA